MKKISLFKMIDDNLVFCGSSPTYGRHRTLEEIKKMIDDKMQHQLTGEYVAIPSLMYKLDRK